MAVCAKEIQNVLFSMVGVMIPAFPAASEWNDSPAAPTRCRGKNGREDVTPQEPPATKEPNSA
jgi:hypothetical protein